MSSENDKPRDGESRGDSADPAAPPPAEAKPPKTGDPVARGSGDDPDSAVDPPSEKKPSKAAYYDDPYDEYGYELDEVDSGGSSSKTAVAKPKAAAGGSPPAPPPPPTADEDEEGDEEEDRMLRMSFLEHLEELRTRLVRSFIGLVVAYLGALAFAPDLFRVFVRPFQRAAEKLPYDPPLQLTQITPTEQFYLEYIKIPILAAIFIAAPWLMYQAWGFISPGLYKRERRFAAPFIFTTSALFILGGLFCYFIALRFALAFLVGLAYETDVRPMISLSSYYDMFFNLHVGLGVVFQMPIVIFFFTLLRITSPGFLIANGRYAILIIFIIAAVITPTPDVTTMMTFAAPMILLYYVGIGASYLIIYKREHKRLPWKALGWAFAVLLAIVAAVMAYMYFGLDYRFTDRWPFFIPPA